MKPISFDKRRLQKIKAIFLTPHRLDVTHIRYRIEDKWLLQTFYLGQLLDGDWDLEAEDFVFPFREDLKDPHIGSKHRSIYQRFVEGREWNETDLFVNVYRKRLSDAPVKGSKDLDTIVQKYSYYDHMFCEIKRNGIRPPGLFRPKRDPLIVHVRRNNEIIWGSNGHHRLAMCVTLGIRVIPVYVGAIHEKADNPYQYLT